MATHEPGGDTDLDVIWLRPEHTGRGRPASQSRSGIAAAAIRLADAEGLDAVSMRRLAAELSTGAASLYRYVTNREELLDLMVDATAAEYEFAAPTGQWCADLVQVAEQALAIMRRHPWLATLVITRAPVGPRGVDLLEHVLDILARHPAAAPTKLQAFAVLTGWIATFAQYTASTDPGRQARDVAYLTHIAVSGSHPRLANALAEAAAAGTTERVFGEVAARLLTGLLPSG